MRTIQSLMRAATVLIAAGAVTDAWAGKNKAPTVSLTSPSSGATFTAPASVVMSATASDSDGTVSKVDFYQGTTLIGSDTTAPYSFTWTNVGAGNYSLTAKATDNGGAVGTSTVVSISVAAAPIIQSPSNGAQLYGSSVTVSGAYTGVPATTTVLADNGNSTVLAVRNGNAYSVTLPLFRGPTTLTVRVARSDKTSDTASITVNGNDAPVVAITSPTGTTFAAPVSLNVIANAISPGGSISNVVFAANGTILATVSTPPYQFSWNNISRGSYALTATASDNNGVTSTATTYLTVTAPNAPPNVSLSTPVDGSTFTAPASFTMLASASDPDDYVSFVDFLVNGAVVGTSYAAPFRFDVSGLGIGTYTLTARATDSQNASTVSSPVTITVAPPNVPPTVSLDSPQTGATFTTPVTISLFAGASDSDGTVSQVAFYQGSTLIGTVTSPPYAFNWVNVPAGSYTLKAVATDNSGGATTSSLVNITVNDPPPNNPPSVTLTSPLGGAEFFAPASITLKAAAADSDGSVAKVEFYQGGTLLGTATAAPYGFVWTNVAAGTYSIVAKATDNQNSATTSAPINILVKDLQLTITSPSGGIPLVGARTTVTGTFNGAFNSGVTVNGKVAALDQNNNFYADVALIAGDNTLQVTLSTPEGQTLTRSVSVTSDGAPPFLTITVDPQSLEGISPLTVKYSLTNTLSTPVAVQVNGGASITLPPSGTGSFTAGYSGAGPRTIQFLADDGLGRTSTQSFTVVVQDGASMDQRFLAAWNGMNNALIAGDKATAMKYLSEQAQAKYGPVFDELMPNYANVVAGFSSPVRSSLSADMCEYAINQMVQGSNRIYFVYFTRGADGIWRLDEM